MLEDLFALVVRPRGPMLTATAACVLAYALLGLWLRRRFRPPPSA